MSMFFSGKFHTHVGMTWVPCPSHMLAGEAVKTAGGHPGQEAEVGNTIPPSRARDLPAPPALGVVPASAGPAKW